MRFNRINNFLDAIQSKGQYSFIDPEAVDFLGRSLKEIRRSLIRLREDQKVATPVQGFNLIVQPEYRHLGCQPPDLFIDLLMKHLNLPYYVGGLTAAHYYGAAHHAPQTFQVFIPHKRRNIICGKVAISFYQRGILPDSFINQRQVRSGYFCLSGPELTAMDLVKYHAQCGGLSNVATVLSELVESISLDRFAALLSHDGETRAIQRLGYMLEFLGQTELAAIVEKQLLNRSFYFIPLNSSKGTARFERNKRWKVIINEKLEPDV